MRQSLQNGTASVLAGEQQEKYRRIHLQKNPRHAAPHSPHATTEQALINRNPPIPQPQCFYL